KQIIKQWEPAFGRLVEHLRSSSLNKRWGAALFLERLVQCNIVSAHCVQNLLSKTIEDPSSKAKVWLGKDDDDVQSVYICAGDLSQMLCKVLMRMSSVDETSTETDVYHIKNCIIEDFNAAETSASLASCINIDEDPLDSGCESDASEDVERQMVENIPKRRNSAQVPIRSNNKDNIKLAQRPNSSRVDQRPVPSKKPGEKSTICSII
ncbi:unnamed protein product, partial [Rotaria sp. Silwood1]